MSKIHLMNDNLANKIAAGEVVEHVLSVVKELVENSIDAKSNVIRVDLKSSGIKEIKVSDNGTGMGKEDALLAFSSHATSKIRTDDDLYFINTLGFRGEALASIASVSDINLKTCENDVGTEVINIGGKITEVKPAEARVGTTFIVKNLFYNTPARLKFLKTEQAELYLVTSFLEKLALSYPGIKFTLTNDDRVIFATSGSSNLLKTIHEIYGLDISSKMIEINGENDDYAIKGFISKPEILRSNKNNITTIVNGRVIKNNDLFRAINEAYYTYKPEGKYPSIVLNIETDPTLIDVNIHPTKQDIKFSKLEVLEDLIIKTIKSTLYNTLLIPSVHELDFKDEENLEDVIIKKSNTSDYNFFNEKAPAIEESQLKFTFAENVSVKKEDVINEEIKALKLYPVGLVLGTYIVAQNEEGMYLIDQHAAQERINYEKYFKALKQNNYKTINMIIPIVIELSHSDFIFLKNNIIILQNIGIKIEEFGINSYKVISHPTWLKVGYEEEQIRKIIDLVILNKDKFDVNKFNEHVAITLACKTSIKGNMNISHVAQEELLDELVKTDNPYNCPHGRPTIITYKIYDLEKMFKRAMD